MFHENLSFLLFYLLKEVVAIPIEYNLENGISSSSDTIFGINRWVFISAVSLPFVFILLCLWCWCIGRVSAKNIESNKKERYILEHQQNTLPRDRNKGGSHNSSDSSSFTDKILSPHKEVEKEVKYMKNKNKRNVGKIEENNTIDLSSIKIKDPNTFLASSPIVNDRPKKTASPRISPIVNGRPKKTASPRISPIIKEKVKRSTSSPVIKEKVKRSTSSPVIKEKYKKSSSTTSSSTTSSSIIYVPRPKKINTVAAFASKMDSASISSKVSVSSFETSSVASSQSNGSRRKGGKKKGTRRKQSHSSYINEFYNPSTPLGMSPILNYNGVPSPMNPSPINPNIMNPATMNAQAYYQQLYNNAAAQMASIPSPYFSPYNQSPYYGANGINMAPTLTTNPYNSPPYFASKPAKTNKWKK